MKKITGILLCLLLTAALCFSVLAAGTLSASMTPAKTTVSRGESVVVTVSISEFANCKGGSLELSFDEAVFERSNNEWLLTGTTMSVASGKAVFAYGTDAAKTISGDIYRFTLTARSDAAIAAASVSATLTLNSSDGTTEKVTLQATITVTCTHSYDNACDEDCNICGESRTVTHSYDAGKVTTAATCTAEGVKTYTCTVCGATKTESVAKADHTYDSGKITTDATCDGSGVMTYTCTACGATKTDSIDSKGHTYDDGKVTTEATCTADGVKTYTCTACGKTKTEIVKAPGHAYDSDCDTDCDKCGAVRQASHKWRSSWSSNAEGHYHVCSTCGEKKDEAAHTPGAVATEQNDQKCTVCGYVIQEALGHTHKFADEFSFDDAGHWYACSGCQVREVQAHSFDNTCDTICDICGYTRAVEHNYSERWIFDETGHWHECTDCGDKLEIYTHVPGPEATEESDQICAECGYVLQAAANHEHSPIGDWLSNAQNHWQQCACGVHLNETAHTWGDGVKGDEPGVTVFYCTECGYPMYCTDEVDPDPSTPAASQPGTNDPQESQPQSGGNTTKGDDQGFPWWIVIVIVGVLVLGGIIFVIIGIIVSKKQTGKYSSK